MDDPLLAAALEYAERGLSVYPLVPGKKVPFAGPNAPQGAHDCPSGRQHQHGHLDATMDPEIITAWWQEHPSANIGIPTGALNGISVLDVDVDPDAVDDNGNPRPIDGERTLAALCARVGCPLDGYAQQRTWSGGRQILTAYHELAKQGAGSYGEGLDGRNDGGYIVAPPSVVNGKRYEWITPLTPGTLLPFPGWLLEAATQVTRAARTTTGSALGGPRTDFAVLEQTGVKKGQRDDAAWKLIGHFRYTGVSKAECYARVDGFGRRCSPPFDTSTDRRIAQKIERAYRKPIDGEPIQRHREPPLTVPSISGGSPIERPLPMPAIPDEQVASW
jgi:bifunctional DNA primase/polymerase-like protein/primase-like protein